MDNDPPTGSDKGSSPVSSRPSRLAKFWQELRRRKVTRVAITYAIVAWLVIQVATTTFPTLGFPDWALRLFTMCVIFGFPVALILAWAFELTPEGIKPTKVARQEKPDTVESTAHVSTRRNHY